MKDSALNKSFKSWWTDFIEFYFMLDNEILIKFGVFVILAPDIFFTSLIKSISFILEISLCDILRLMHLFFLGKTQNLVPTLIRLSNVSGSSPSPSISPQGNTALSSSIQCTLQACLADVELASIAFLSGSPIHSSFPIIETTEVESLHKPILKRLLKISHDNLAGFLRQELCHLNLPLFFWQVSLTCWNLQRLHVIR